MAAIVHSAQTGTTATGVLTTPTATAGNELVAFFTQNGANTPTFSSTEGFGSTGWTVESIKSVFTGSANSVWVARKTAVGGETGVSVTPGAEGTAQGVAYFEISGGPFTVDGEVLHKDNNGSAKTVSTPSLTTTDAGDVILAAIGAAATTGTISAWTGTGPMTNIATTTTRCIGGSYIPGTTVSGAVFTANWETAKGTGVLLIALKPAAAATARPVMVF